jgi:superfamily II DNA/RNA helicase
VPKNLRSAAPKKARWTADQKAAAKKGPKKAHRGQSVAPTKQGYAARSARDDERGSRRFDRDDRPARREVSRDERPTKRYDSDDRPPKRFERDDRPARRDVSRDDRAPRRTDRDDRGPRRFERDERAPRRFDRDDRPAKRFDREDRAPRRFDRDERPTRRDFSRDDRAPRRFDRDERARHEHVDAEAQRIEADTWTKATRKGVDGPVSVAADNGFAALGLSERLVERLARDGIAAPFPIQAATIPDALAGRDVLGRGQTGSGKTLAFGLPLLTRLADGVKAAPRRPRALVLVPTRELAMQVSDALEPLVHVLGLRHKLVAGGLSYTTQIAALNRGVEVLIATPGRLKDLIEREAVQLGEIEVAVLDEADHMADMGFLPEVTALLDQMPAGGQRLLFSATLDKGVDKIVEGYLTDPVTHSTDDVKASVTTMEHHVLLIDPMHKKTITAEVANRDGRTVVFVRTKLGADRVATQLREAGVFAAALHGGLNQGARNRVLGAFRDGTLPVLVATDVAARGIHVDDVSVVLQVDPPADHKDYLHRAGRTARAGEKGTVVTFALPHQKRTMARLADAAGLEVEPIRVRPGDENVAAAGGRAPSGIPVADHVWKPLLEAKEQPRGRRPGGPPRRFQGASRGHQGGSRGGERRSQGGRAEWKRDR